MTSLISIPVRAAVGGAVYGGLNSGISILDGIKQSLFSNQTLGNILSVGTNIGLDAAGTPAIARNFISGFLGQLAGGQDISSKIGEGLQKFGRGIFSAVGSVVSFGQKVIEGVGNFTAQGFKKAIGAFSSVFSRQTQEGIYQDETGLRNATVTVHGNIWTWQNGTSRIDYNVQTSEAVESFGVGGTARITSLGQDDAGNIFSSELTYENVINDSMIQKQTYEDGQLTQFTLRHMDTGETIFEIEGDGNSIFIPGPTEPLPTEKLNIDFGPVRLGFEMGRLAHVSINSVNSTSAGENQNHDTNQELYALTNGFLNSEFFSAPRYLFNLRQDIVAQSESHVEEGDIILAPTFFASTLIGAWNTLETIKNIFELNPVGLFFNTVFDEAIEWVENFIKDSTLWLSEMFDSNTYGTIATNIYNALESHFMQNQNDRARELVGVGYSGGFLPLGEVLVSNAYAAETETGFNAVSLVGLGGVNIQLNGPYRKILDKMVEIGEILAKASTRTTEFLSNIRIELNSLAALAAGLTGVISLNQTEVDQVYQTLVEGSIDAAYQIFIHIAQEKTRLWNGFEPALDATSNIGVVVNVYGDKDIITKLSVGDQTIGGYRESIGQYNIDDRNHQLINIEIKGASHYDYVHSDDQIQWWKGVLNAAADTVDWFLTTEDEEWNVTVSEFVARLISNSQTKDKVDAFLRALGPQVANFNALQQEWIITLPGSESRASS